VNLCLHSAEKLSQGDWLSLEELIIGKNIFRKMEIHNLEIKDAGKLP